MASLPVWPPPQGSPTSDHDVVDWIFEDPRSKALLAEVEQVAPSDASVLITGETGTGKELIARRIHSRSPRRHGPFVVVSCGAFSDALVDAELFGHENGAFAGAFGSQPGWFEEAHGGTIFLDEVNDLPLSICRSWSSRSAFARTCTTASTWSASMCSRSRSGRATSCPWRAISSTTTAAAWVTRGWP